MSISDWSSYVCSSDLTRPLDRAMRIFDQGEPAGRAHALLSGCVRITQAGSDGEEILVRLIGPGEIFGCVPILTDRLYPADATAIVDSVEVSWDPAELLALMERHSRIARLEEHTSELHSLMR